MGEQTVNIDKRDSKDEGTAGTAGTIFKVSIGLMFSCDRITDLCPQERSTIAFAVSDAAAVPAVLAVPSIFGNLNLA